MNSSVSILEFDCMGDRLLGLLHAPAGTPAYGVLIITGGPQYRVGSHRQFLLLARELAAHGVAAMRFDFRGMGDSEGAPRSYDQTHDDIRAAVTAFLDVLPVFARLVLWGLCDGATAAALYAAGDDRINGLILLNPWVHSPALQQQVLLRHYYPRRLLSAQFWATLLQERGALRAHMAHCLGQLLSRHRQRQPQVARSATRKAEAPPQQLHRSLQAYQGRVLIVLAGADLGARQLLHLQSSQARWRKLLARRATSIHLIEGANHTFASRRWRDQVSKCCIDWIRT